MSSLMTVAEVKRWPREKRWGRLKIESLERAIALHTIVLPDIATADCWADIFTSRRRLGRPILHGDCWIAATAVRHGLPLVTHNASDYAGIPGLQLVTKSG